MPAAAPARSRTLHAASRRSRVTRRGVYFYTGWHAPCSLLPGTSRVAEGMPKVSILHISSAVVIVVALLKLLGLE